MAWLLVAPVVTVTAADAAPAPTPTPPPPAFCVPIPCGGRCAIPAPCSPGTICPQYVVEGQCEVVFNTCMCVTNPLTPVPTPTFGGCGLACDGRPCVGRCGDGNTVQGVCSSLTIDRGCACAFDCTTPTPSPSPTPPGTARPCTGDCDGNGAVTVDEIVRMVDIALGGAPSANTCPGVEQWCSSGPVLSVDVTCVIDAVKDALGGCPVPPPALSLSVHVARNADTQTLQAVADLANTGAVPVAYLSGCSAMCQPKFYRAIAFQVIGPDGSEVVLEEPCGGVLLCPEGPLVLVPGASLEQTLDITGSEWLQDTAAGGECGTCSQKALEPGTYTVVARFEYSTNVGNPWPFPDHIETSAQFGWPE